MSSLKKIKIVSIPKVNANKISNIKDARPLGLTSSLLNILEIFIKHFFYMF